MSNLTMDKIRRRACAWILILAGFGVGLLSTKGAAQLPGAQEWARGIVGPRIRPYYGDRVAWPDLCAEVPALIPTPSVLSRSIAIHWRTGESADLYFAVSRELDAFASWLEATGWGAVSQNSARGAFDVIVSDSNDPCAFENAGSVSYDGVHARALVDYRLLVEDLGAIDEAYARALLLEREPAESKAWRDATAAWLVYAWRGSFVEDPERGQGITQTASMNWIATGYPLRGALFLAMLSERHDPDGTRFVRDLWDLARQKSEDGGDYYGTPDLWDAVSVAIEDARDPLHQLVEDAAVALYFSGRADAPFRVLRGLSPNVAPVADEVRFSELPEHRDCPVGELEPFGSSYTRVNLDMPHPARLRVWLKGEDGVRWSLAAVQLDGNGAEIGRISAPARREPSSFIPLELSPSAKSVLLVVTNLSSRLPDADVPDENVRSFQLILDR